MRQSFQPEIIQRPAAYGPHTQTNPYDTEYGAYPLRLACNPVDMRVRYIQMSDFIKQLQTKQEPLSHHSQTFTIPGMQAHETLETDLEQRRIHTSLNNIGFDFSKAPFKLQKWDKAIQRWGMLTVDCQLMAASFLVSLNANLTGEFKDRVHHPQMMDFRTKKIFHADTAQLDYIEVTPVLVTRTQNFAEQVEYLNLTLTGDVSFPNLKFTTPAVMADPAADFSCSICFGDATEPIFRTGCGGKDGHCFHKKCIQTWFGTGKSSCPCCRTTIHHAIR